MTLLDEIRRYLTLMATASDFVGGFAVETKESGKIRVNVSKIHGKLASVVVQDSKGKKHDVTDYIYLRRLTDETC